ncbi:hypothetical protein H5404_18035 [Vibrio parahaemolyticus]|uniref:hypothetical protein n=1 Tax=Vibrio parahaemolyticus TaxID=670 RepID=UPI00162A1F3C|nr:hypothetical protein [Vibrio parahaemolyticus]QNE57722.1 hypothetical protein H5404_18035 [Vibrio parahaemolyticus]
MSDTQTLPPLAEIGQRHNSQIEGLALSINEEVQDYLAEKDMIGNMFNLVFQLRHDQDEQLVVLEELECKEEFLASGLIVETDKGCENTFIIPQDSARVFIQ